MTDMKTYRVCYVKNNYKKYTIFFAYLFLDDRESHLGIEVSPPQSTTINALAAAAASASPPRAPNLRHKEPSREQLHHVPIAPNTSTMSRSSSYEYNSSQ